MIRTYQGFIALKNAVEEFPSAGGTYTKPKIDRNTIMDAEFVLIPGMEVDEYVKEKGGSIPVQIAGKGYYEWLEAPTVQDIIVDRLDRNANAPVTDIVDAVFHYLEYDAFKE
jgi:hypothetical protein